MSKSHDTPLWWPLDPSPTPFKIRQIRIMSPEAAKEELTRKAEEARRENEKTQAELKTLPEEIKRHAETKKSLDEQLAKARAKTESLEEEISRKSGEIAEFERNSCDLEEKLKRIGEKKTGLEEKLKRMQAEYDGGYAAYIEALTHIKECYDGDAEILRYYGIDDPVDEVSRKDIDSLMHNAETAIAEIEKCIKILVEARQKKEERN
jgi:chromosome segregation ATPase